MGGEINRPDAYAQTPERLPAITSVASFYTLIPTEIARGYPVRLRGTVLYIDPAWNVCWLYEEGATLFFEPGASAGSIRAGDQVDVSGRTALESNNYRLVNPSLTVLGRGSFPTTSTLETPQMRGQQDPPSWANISGTIRNIKIEPPNPIRLDL